MIMDDNDDKLIMTMINTMVMYRGIWGSQKRKCRVVSWDLVGHFEWSNLVKKAGLELSTTKYISQKYIGIFSVSPVPADGLAPLGARLSADTVMTKFASSINNGPVLNGLLFLIINMVLPIV